MESLRSVSLQATALTYFCSLQPNSHIFINISIQAFYVQSIMKLPFIVYVTVLYYL